MHIIRSYQGQNQYQMIEVALEYSLFRRNALVCSTVISLLCSIGSLSITKTIKNIILIKSWYHLSFSVSKKKKKKQLSGAKIQYNAGFCLSSYYRKIFCFLVETASAYHKVFIVICGFATKFLMTKIKGKKKPNWRRGSAVLAGFYRCARSFVEILSFAWHLNEISRERNF